jgi:predicted phage-related endonuclease
MPGLTKAQLEARKGKLGGSQVGPLMTGDRDGIQELWLELIGDRPPKDFSDVWPVQRGIYSEPLNLIWFEKKHGVLIRQGEVVLNPEWPWSCATLDAWCVPIDMPVECKDVGGREPLERVLDRYQPQLQYIMKLTGSNQIALSVIFGGNEPIVEFIPFAPDYATEMMKRVEQFMGYNVAKRIPPVAIEPTAAPVLAVKTYDMSENNEWGHNAIAWLETRKAKEECLIAEKNLKSMVPADAKITRGRGIVITRNRAGSLSLREDVR